MQIAIINTAMTILSIIFINFAVQKAQLQCKVTKKSLKRETFKA